MRLRALGLALLAWTSAAGAQTLDEAPPTTDPVEAAATLTGPIVSVVIATPLRGEDPWQRVGLSPGLAFTAARARRRSVTRSRAAPSRRAACRRGPLMAAWSSCCEASGDTTSSTSTCAARRRETPSWCAKTPTSTAT